MRSDLTEINRPERPRAGHASRHDIAPLPATAVDEALADESTLAAAAEQGVRRDVPIRGAAAVRMAIDDAHRGAVARVADAADDSLLQQLSRQLELLEVQQHQIRRLLEVSERRWGARRANC